jgi:hypothetical protein
MHKHPQERRAMEQLSLDLFYTHNPHAYLWEGLAEPQRALALEVLARMIAKAVHSGGAPLPEGPSDE